MAETEEIEVNFRLDGAGRTALHASGTTETNEGSSFMNYDTTATRIRLGTSGKNETTEEGGGKNDAAALIDELLYDCEIADSGIMPRTFWFASNGRPRFTLEQVALDVFEHHTRNLPREAFDPNTSGAEWWVQIRPSAEQTGRYAMHCRDDGDEKDDVDLSREGISFHWDKDEDLRLLCGGNIFVHPHLSTVTYLTGIGAPTLIVNCRVKNMTGAWITPDDPEVFISWPASGKHVSFDGRFLHAAPSDLMEEGAFERQCRFTVNREGKDKDQCLQEEKLLSRRHRRVTFLVNIWLNYRPFGVDPFPDTMVDKMSGHNHNDAERVRLSVAADGEDNEIVRIYTTDIQDDIRKEKIPRPLPSCLPWDLLTWPMGDSGSGEMIQMSLDLTIVRCRAKCGGNDRFRWKGKNAVAKAVRLFRRQQSSSEEKPTKRQKHGDTSAE